MKFILLAGVCVFAIYVLLLFKRVLHEVRIQKVRQSGLFERQDWSVVPFESPSLPMRMVISAISTQRVFQRSFEISVNRFVRLALTVDPSLSPEKVQGYMDVLLQDVSKIQFLSGTNLPREYRMIQAAILYAIVCTQEKGANIRKRLMLGKNGSPNGDVFKQIHTDREYLIYMNDQFSAFCIAVGILEPRLSQQIQVASGYLILD